MGIHGFSGNKSLLYHLRPPTAVQRIEPRLRGQDELGADQGPLRHRLLRTATFPPAAMRCRGACR